MAIGCGQGFQSITSGMSTGASILTEPDRGGTGGTTTVPSPSLSEKACTGVNLPYSATENKAIEDVCIYTNNQRQAAGVELLVLDLPITEVAMAHARDMRDRNYFSHVNPEGMNPFDRLRAAGVQFALAGENIAMGQATATRVVQSWMSSGTHRANMLRPEFGKIGVGNAGTYWVQAFTD